MAVKNGSYEKFKAIQMNNEEIAQQDFAGMRRSSEGWHLTGSTANSILGGKPLLKAGGTGAMILDLASTEPKPQTVGQAVLKAAGKWKPLNEHYANGGAIGNADTAATPMGQVKPQKSAVTLDAGLGTAANKGMIQAGSGALVQTTPGMSATDVAAKAGAQSAAKTYTVNGKQMTLGEYIKALGTDPNAAYRQNVAAANAAYDRQRATYGAEAEAMAGQGLANSGTSDYMDAQAYAAKQQAISRAAAARDQQMTEIAGQHMSYLQQEKAAQDAKIQTALERAASMQLNSANTVKYLMAMTGMTKSEAERYAEGNATLVAEEDNTQATLQEITQTYLALMQSAKDGGMGMSSEAARQYLKSGTYSYDGALVDQAVNNLVGAQEQAKADQTAQAQKAVSDVFDKSISVWDGATAQAKLAELGITVTPDEEDGAIPLRDMRNALVVAYNNQMINEEQYLSLMKSEADNALNAASEGTISDRMQVAIDLDSDRQIYDHVLGELARKSTISIKEDKVGGKSMGTAILSANVDGEKFKTTLTLGSKDAVPDKVAKKRVTVGDVISYNGKLYLGVQNNDGSQKFWVEAKIKNNIAAIKTKEQINTFMEMVSVYYQKQ